MNEFTKKVKSCVWDVYWIAENDCEHVMEKITAIYWIKLDFDRKKQVWHILPNVGTNIKYKVNFEDIEVNKKVDSLKYNGKAEVGIAISNSFTIEKNSVPQDLVDDTLFLVLDDNIGINSVDGLISQNSLLEQLTNIMGELSNTKDKIHELNTPDK